MSAISAVGIVLALLAVRFAVLCFLATGEDDS